MDQFRPAADTLSVSEQILPDLNLGVRQERGIGMEGNGKIGSIHRVGLVVADHKFMTFAQRGYQLQCEATVPAIMKDTDMPWTVDGVHDRGKAVQRNQYRGQPFSPPPVDFVRNRPVVGLVNLIHSSQLLDGAELRVAGDCSPVADVQN